MLAEAGDGVDVENERPHHLRPVHDWLAHEIIDVSDGAVGEVLAK